MADAWTNDAADYGDKQRRGGTLKRVLITLLEPHCFLPIVLFFLIGGVMVFRSQDDSHATAVHHATAAGLNVMSASEARAKRQQESPKKVVAVFKEREHVNEAYPCDDYDDCQSCVSGGCGWCLGQGWCVEDQPGICSGFEDHIGRATGNVECPKDAKSSADIERELAERLSAKLHDGDGEGGGSEDGGSEDGGKGDGAAPAATAAP